jgi:hypothetical protein
MTDDTENWIALAAATRNAVLFLRARELIATAGAGGLTPTVAVPVAEDANAGKSEIVMNVSDQDSFRDEAGASDAEQSAHAWLEPQCMRQNSPRSQPR